MKFKSFIWTALIAMAAAAAIVGAKAADISGAGATFPYPIYAKWADAYKKQTGNGLNYQSIGSGGGIKQIEAATVTFGATDKPLQSADLDKHGLVQWPMVMGGIVPVVTLQGINPGDIVLDGPTLANIFLGTIKTWDDPAIKKLNPNLKLPSMAIAVVHRSDGSGTTFNFTDYLSKVSPAWKANVGESTAVEWPVGIGAKGNEGVANNIAADPGRDRLPRICLCDAEQAHLYGHDEQGGQEGRADHAVLPIGRGQCRLGARAGLLSNPDRPAGRQLLADHSLDLHPDAKAAAGSRRSYRSLEVLQLGLRQRRQDGGRTRLYPDAGFGGGSHQEDLGRARSKAPTARLCSIKFTRVRNKRKLRFVRIRF